MFWRLAVVGSPVAHSLSPRLFDAALLSTGQSGSSGYVDIDLEHLELLDDAIARYDALSLTMPLKEVALQRCDSTDEVASRVGAINSMRIRDGRVEGRLTDGVGFLDALRADFDMDVAGRHVVVRGSGGSAKALIDAFVYAGAASVALHARNRYQCERIVDRYPRIVTELPGAHRIDLVVNTVPYREAETVDLDDSPFTYGDDAVAIDIVYVPVETPWLASQRLAGRRTANGLSMLIHQARHQLEWWLEREVPLAALRSAVAT